MLFTAAANISLSDSASAWINMDRGKAVHSTYTHATANMYTFIYSTTDKITPKSRKQTQQLSDYIFFLSPSSFL